MILWSFLLLPLLVMSFGLRNFSQNVSTCYVCISRNENLPVLLYFRYYHCRIIIMWLIRSFSSCAPGDIHDTLVSWANAHSRVCTHVLHFKGPLLQLLYKRTGYWSQVSAHVGQICKLCLSAHGRLPRTLQY